MYDDNFGGLPPECEPCFVISIVSRMVKMHPQTIRHYEEIGLVKPSRTKGRRLYSKKEVEKLKQISAYTDLGVNLAGVEMILKLLEQMNQMEKEAEKFKKQFLEES